MYRRKNPDILFFLTYNEIILLERSNLPPPLPFIINRRFCMSGTVKSQRINPVKVDHSGI